MINWNMKQKETIERMETFDSQWHMTKTSTHNEDGKFFLSNFEILLTPHGTGVDYKECFESFIANCDKYAEKLAEVKAEAQRHLDEFLTFEKELENEN